MLISLFFVTLHMTLHFTLANITNLVQRYKAVRQTSLDICKPLSREDYVPQPIADVSPPKWHLGHITWFFENFIIANYVSDYTLFDERLNYFFNSYYEGQGPRILRSNRGNMTRPTLEKVIAYRKHIDEQMVALIESYQGKPFPEELHHFIIVGLHHEQQHQELLVTDIKYILGTNPLYPIYSSQPQAEEAIGIIDLNFIRIEEGLYDIGYEGQGFCWDNEQSAHKVFLHEFNILDRLITNGEYMEFMAAGGYENYEFWLMEGIEWARQLEIKAPLYWYPKDGEWYHYTLNGLQKVNPDLPVTHISYYEADAFARWKGYRLPTEFEWEVACTQFYEAIPDDGNFLETQNFHPAVRKSAVDKQMLGHTWEWTSSAYAPYPNYPRFKGALGEYNGKFMVNQMVLRGGSCATPLSHIRMTYRNFFHADKRWQFTGLRLAK